MTFDDLEAKMRRFETAHDHCKYGVMWLAGSAA